MEKKHVFKTSKRQCFTIFGSSLFVFDHVLSNSFRNNKKTTRCLFNVIKWNMIFTLTSRAFMNIYLICCMQGVPISTFSSKAKVCGACKQPRCSKYITINGLSSQLLHCFGFMKPHRTSRKICALEYPQ